MKELNDMLGEFFLLLFQIIGQSGFKLSQLFLFYFQTIQDQRSKKQQFKIIAQSAVQETKMCGPCVMLQEWVCWVCEVGSGLY